MRINKLIVDSDACCIVANAHEKGRAGRGKASCGVVYLAETKELSSIVAEKGKYLGEMTVPEAEYHGLIFALDYASEFCRGELEVWLDSELVVRHLNGIYKLKAKNLKLLFDQVRKLQHRYKSVVFFHHKRENEVAQLADAIAKRYQS